MSTSYFIELIESLQHRTGNLRVWSETDRSGGPGIYMCVREAETERPQIAFKGRILQSLTIGLGPTISDCATRKRIGKYVCWLRRMIQRRQIHLIVNRQRPHWTELRLSRSLLPSANKHFIATSAMRPALADMIAVTICDKGMISGLTCSAAPIFRPN